VKKETAEKLLTLSREEYDMYASEFSGTRKFFWRELEFLKDYIALNDKVLDVGCGNGRLLDLFEGTSIEYTGVDSSKELIAIAKRERGASATFVHADALSLPFKGNSFDAVFSIAMLHHIPSKENRVKCITEVYRVLKPGGVCVFTIWNTLQWRFAKAHFNFFIKKLLGVSDLDFGDMIIPFGKKKRKRFVHTPTKRELQKLFEKCGFSDIVIQEVKRNSGFSNYVITTKK